MKTSELRIGNLLEFSNGIQPSKIVMVGRRFFSSASIEKEDNDFEITPHYRPILLTDEWLLKAGFEKDDTGVDIYDQDYHEWYQKELPIIGIICQSSDKSYLFDENTDTLRIKYVHQLQNLIFALTGEELIFNI